MKIPDDVYSTRCCYCVHGRENTENEEIPNEKVFVNSWANRSPCKIIGISRCREVPGECLCFKPNPMFGICEYCAYTNGIHDGFCTAPGGPKNKRRVFLGWNCQEGYWGDHALFTCDRYQVRERWKDLILQNATEGRAPANFDPDTWDAVEYIDGTGTAKKWADLQAKRTAQLLAEAERKTENEAKKAAAEEEKQLTMFD